MCASDVLVTFSPLRTPSNCSVYTWPSNNVGNILGPHRKQAAMRVEGGENPSAFEWATSPAVSSHFAPVPLLGFVLAYASVTFSHVSPCPCAQIWLLPLPHSDHRLTLVSRNVLAGMPAPTSEVDGSFRMQILTAHTTIRHKAFGWIEYFKRIGDANFPGFCAPCCFSKI